MSSLNIRKAVQKDVAAIMRLEYLCFDQDTIEDESVYLERIAIFPAGCLVLEISGELVGFVSSEIWSEPDTINQDLFELGHSISSRYQAEGNCFYISSIAIDPTFQGKGYGELLFNSLLSRVLETYPNINQSYLLVGSLWKNAYKIYLKHGYEVVTVFSDFFGGNSVEAYDGIVMHKYFTK